MEWYLKRGIRSLVGMFLKSRVVSPGSIDWSRVKRVLVIRQHDPIGDVVMTTPAFRALKAALPGAEMDLVVRPEVAGLFEGDPRFKRVWLYDKRGFKRSPDSLWKMIRSWRALGYDAAFVFGNTSFSATSAWLAYVSRATLRIGYTGEAFGYEGFSRSFYTTEIPWVATGGSEVGKHLKLLEAVGVEVSDGRHELFVSNRAIQQADRALAEAGIGPGETVVALHPGAGKLLHRWPVSRFGTLSDLARAKGWRTVVMGGPGEAALVETVKQAAFLGTVTLPFLSLEVLAAVFKRCRLVVCNDTAPLHVAAGVGVPTVAIFGPSDPAEWNPAGKNQRAVRGADGTCASVAVESVWREVELIMESKR